MSLRLGIQWGQMHPNEIAVNLLKSIKLAENGHKK